MTGIKEMLIMLPFKFNEHSFWNVVWAELLIDCVWVGGVLFTHGCNFKTSGTSCCIFSYKNLEHEDIG